MEEGEDLQEESAKDESEEKKDIDKAVKKDADVSKNDKMEETPMDTETE